VKAAVISMLGPGGPTGKRVLDLFAGTGAFGIEALSRSAAEAEFVEINDRRCRDIRRSLAGLGLETRGRVRRGDAAAVVRRLDGEFDIVFVDPPYGENPFEKVMSALDRKGTLADGALVFAEHSTRLTLPERLPGVLLDRRRRYGDTTISVFRHDVAASEAPDDGTA